MPLKGEKSFWRRYSRFYPYLERATPYRHLIQDTISFAAHPDPKVVCDLGCGAGALLVNYLKAFPAVQKAIAVDFCEEFLSFTRSRLKQECPEFLRAGKVAFLLHDLRNPLPLHDNTLDVLLAGLVLPYITSHNGRNGVGALLGLLQEAHRVLREGGVFVWSTPVQGVNFWHVFLASLVDMLDFHHPENLFYGPVLLFHALSIQRKGKRGVYIFPSEQALWAMHEASGFSKLIVCRSLSNQAFLIRAVKGNKTGER
jgi:SAM-dependent methyltransferase